MADPSIVMGGWGVSPEVLRPLFGEESIYIDSNTLLPLLLENGTLKSNWPHIVAQHLKPFFTDRTLLAGWSTGAMLAYGAAAITCPDRLLLISATPSFCRTSTFRYGLRSSLLVAMRERLIIDKAAVLTDFTERCGLTTNHTPSWSVNDLCEGLNFLEQAELNQLPQPSCTINFIHGKNDTVIPSAAGEYFSTQCNAPLTLLEGPHACFINNTEIIQSILSTFPKGTNHESV